MGDSDGQLETEQAIRDELKKQAGGSQRMTVEDPTIKNSILTGIEDQYALLFSTLALSPGKEETLKIILSKSVMDYIVLNPEVMNAVTAEEKAQLQQRYDALRRETQLRVEAILGPDNYAKYQKYEDRTFSRKVVSEFAESLPPHNGLTESQMNELIEIIYENAQEVYADIGYDPTIRLDFPVDMKPEAVSKRMEITNRILFNAADSSREILSASQLEAYDNYLRDYSERMEMSLLKQGLSFEQ
jgi:hypothetical protein